MYIFATASADTYITNKIVDGSRVEDANVGRAGTLDLFKLYDETLSGSTGGHTELSRLLIKFDVGRLRTLATGTIDLNTSSFKAKMRLKNVSTGLPSPRNFTVSVFPLAQAFEEGDGRDVSGFTDIDASSFIKATSTVSWFQSGAYASGAVGDSNIDFFASGNLQDGLGLRSLESKQVFYDGTEDLFVDVTDVVSATIAGVIPDHGMLIAFTSSQESDSTSRFVKRFASRHVTHESLRPRLEVFFNSAIFDAHAGAFFDSTGSLYLNNYVGSTRSNLLSASAVIQGNNCLHIVISTGSFSTTVTASQQQVGSSFISGSYFGNFAISAQNSAIVSGTVKLSDHIRSSGSIVFSESWESLDGSVKFLSTFLTCSIPTRTAFDGVARQLNVHATNCKSSYKLNSNHRIRVFAYDSNYEPNATRVPKPTLSSLPETYYRIRDLDGEIYVPFERDNGGTRMSTDSGGLFFDLYTDGLPSGRLLTFDYLVVDRGQEYVVEDKNVKFTVGE